jgi:hypothetical protein
MSWKSVTFTGQDIRDGKVMRLQEQFAEIFMRAGAPAAAVMYGSGTVLRDGDICYFTPAAADLAPKLLQMYGAVDCAAPDVRFLPVLVKNSTGGDSD